MLAPNLSLWMPRLQLPAPRGPVEPGCQIFPRGIRDFIHSSSIHTDPRSSRADRI